MSNIKSVSDLGNYNEVLKDIAVGEPVFLREIGFYLMNRDLHQT